MDLNSLGLACARLSECGDSPRRQKAPKPRRIGDIEILLNSFLGRRASQEELDSVAALCKHRRGKDAVAEAIKTYKRKTLEYIRRLTTRFSEVL